ncbi:unnamed protein product [Anisakis simplex]|uniref:Signal peptidase complex subunit 1 n=1 Tax=Anisakis simplex TaxID=6269 RepID=A0A158PMS8_ANISI|nr:unnamed protein product [Anisakis simplex]
MDGIIQSLPPWLRQYSTYIDFVGQRKAEKIFQVILVAAAIIGFFIGYTTQQLSHAVYTLGVGFVVSCILVLPPWPYLRRNPIHLPDLGILKCPRCPDRLEALDLEHFVEDGVRYQRVMWMCKGISKGKPKKAVDTSSNASTVSSHGRRKRKRVHLADTSSIVDDGLSVSGRSETPVSSGCATRGSSECPSPVSSTSVASSSCVSSSESAANKCAAPSSKVVCSKSVSSVNSSSNSRSQTILVPATLGDHHTTTATNTSAIDANSCVLTSFEHPPQATSFSMLPDMSTAERSPTIRSSTMAHVSNATASNIDSNECSHLKTSCNSEHLMTTINSIGSDVVHSITGVDSSDKVLASSSSVKYCEGNEANDSSGQQKLPSPSLTSTARSTIESSATNTSEKMPSDETILSQMEYEGDKCGEVEAPMRVVVIDDEIDHSETVDTKKEAATDSMKNISSLSAMDSSVLSKSNSPSQQVSSNQAEFKPTTDIPTSSHHSANDFNPDGVLLPKQIRSLKKFVAQTSSSSAPTDSFAMDDEEYVADFAERCHENLKKDKAKKEEMMRASVCSVSDKRGEASPFEPWMLRRPGMFDKLDWRKPVRLGCGSAWDAFVTNYNLRYNRDSFLKALGEEMRNEGIVCHDATLTVKQQRMMEKVLRSCKELDGEKQLEQLEKTIDLSALREQISNGVGVSEVLQSKCAPHAVDSHRRIEQAKQIGTSNTEEYQGNQSETVFKKVYPRQITVESSETTTEQKMTTTEIKSEDTMVRPLCSDMENTVKEAVQKYVERYVTEMKSSSRKKAKFTRSQLRDEGQSQEFEGETPETQDVQSVCPDGEGSQLFGSCEDEFFEMENNLEFDF